MLSPILRYEQSQPLNDKYPIILYTLVPMPAANTTELCAGCKAARLRVCQRKILEARITPMEYKVSNLEKNMDDPDMADLQGRTARALTSARTTLEKARNQLKEISLWCIQ